MSYSQRIHRLYTFQLLGLYEIYLREYITGKYITINKTIQIDTEGSMKRIKDSVTTITLLSLVTPSVENVHLSLTYKYS